LPYAFGGAPKIKMFAIIETGGKQYKVSPGSKIKVEKIDAEKGGNFVFDKVLLISDDKNVEIGEPYIKGVKVEAKVLGEGRSKKIIVFRYHSKTRYRKKKGHRQPFSEFEILKVNRSK